jgi:hypothetical protein
MWRRLVLGSYLLLIIIFEIVHRTYRQSRLSPDQIYNLPEGPTVCYLPNRGIPTGALNDTPLRDSSLFLYVLEVRSNGNINRINFKTWMRVKYGGHT